MRLVSEGQSSAKHLSGVEPRSPHRTARGSQPVAPRFEQPFASDKPGLGQMEFVEWYNTLTPGNSSARHYH